MAAPCQDWSCNKLQIAYSRLGLLLSMPCRRWFSTMHVMQIVTATLLLGHVSVI